MRDKFFVQVLSPSFQWGRGLSPPNCLNLGEVGNALNHLTRDKDVLAHFCNKGVDLVKIAPQATPPVVKIMDYSKYRYEQSKREKENRKKQKIVETKEIRLSINIDIGDFNTKINQARKFLSKGDKVKVSIRLRGREMAHSDLAVNNCVRFAEELGEEAVVDKKPKLEGRQVLMFLSSKASK